jgi:hypothetical protein
VALQNPAETRKATIATARELAALRGVPWEDMKSEILSVFDRYNGNHYRIFKWFESELQKAREMAAA